ncbi:MAG: Dyp-type peroxidase, partial [Pseudomonadales bacterium]|nr:Dyp-type peroxidase [Pseudomonadales bacterium]
MSYQRGILANIPPVGRYLTFQQYDPSQVKACLQQLCAMVDGEQVVLGLGKSLLLQLDLAHPHLPNFPAYTSAGINIPSTPADLWLWVRGSERGELLLLSQQLIKTLEAAFDCTQIVDAFCHLGGRDLTGYEDGTENPHDEAAIAAAFVADENP